MHILKTMMMPALLLTAMPAMAEDKPKLDRNDPSAVRCKRLEVTGSLVRKERVCKTNAEWRGDQRAAESRCRRPDHAQPCGDEPQRLRAFPTIPSKRAR